MNSYDLVVFVHIVAAIVLVGGGLLATPTVNAAIRRALTTSELRRWLTVGRPLGRINPISSLALLASGVYLSTVGEWWDAAWVQVAVGLWVLNTVLAAALVKPSMGRLAQLAFGADGEEIGPELEAARRSARLTVTEHVMLANDVGVLFLMVTKPTAYLMAFLAVLLTHLVLFGLQSVQETGTRPTQRAGSVSG